MVIIRTQETMDKEFLQPFLPYTLEPQDRIMPQVYDISIMMSMQLRSDIE